MNKVITTHRTDKASAQHIHEYGVQIERSRPSAAWGRGFYSATRYSPDYGDTAVRVAVRLLRPLIVDDPIAEQERIDALLARSGTDDARQIITTEGYDGVVIHWGAGDIWVVAYRDDQVKVLQGL